MLPDTTAQHAFTLELIIDRCFSPNVITTPTIVAQSYNILDPAASVVIAAFTGSDPLCSNAGFTYAVAISPTPNTAFMTYSVDNLTHTWESADPLNAGVYTVTVTCTF